MVVPMVAMEEARATATLVSKESALKRGTWRDGVSGLGFRV